MLDAEEYLLKNNLIHADIKSSNIVFQKYKNNPKLIDYDTMRKLEPKTKYHECFSNLYYISPELYFLKEISEKTDIYSLGCLLYQLIQKTWVFDKELSIQPENQ